MKVSATPQLMLAACRYADERGSISAESPDSLPYRSPIKIKETLIKMKKSIGRVVVGILQRSDNAVFLQNDARRKSGAVIGVPAAK